MKNLSLLITALTLLVCSCETELELPRESTSSRLVVNGLVSNSKQVEIMVSKTMPLGKSPVIEFPENAQVKITDNNGNTWPCTFNLGLQKYVSSLIPQAGGVYNVSVKLQGFGDATSTLRIPDPFSFIQSTWKDSTNFDEDNFPLGSISVRIDDKAGVKNHYRIALYYYDVFAAEWKVLEPISQDADIEENAIKADDGSIIFSDDGFDGQTRNLRFATPFGYSFQTPKFLVEKESLSDDYFSFFKSLQDYKKPGGVFREVTPVYSNIKNGVGIWAGSYLLRDTIQ